MVALVVVVAVAWVISTAPQPKQGGTINVFIKDATATWQHMTITFGKIEVHQAQSTNDSGWHTLKPQAASVDLVTIGNLSQLIGSAQLSPGMYTGVRIWPSAISGVLANGSKVTVYLYTAYLMTTTPFNLTSTNIVSYTVDLDLARSFVQMPWGAWYFLPVLGPTNVTSG